MPEVGIGEGLLGCFEEILQGGNDFSHVALKAWSETTGLQLSWWDFQTLNAMGSAFNTQLKLSRDSNCPSPLDEAIDRNEQVADEAKTTMRALAERNK